MCKHALLCSMLLGLAASPLLSDVAFMYSGYPKGAKIFSTELDGVFAELNVTAIKYQNTQIVELTNNLPKYDMVVCSTVANYEDTVTLTPYAPAWKKYLENGGVLFLLDATYDSATESFLNCISPELALKQEMCSAHLKPSPETEKTIIQDHPLLNFPYAVRFPLEKLSHWGHFTCQQPDGWTLLETCADGKALTLMHPVGKGLVLVAAHGNLRSTESFDLVREFINNIFFSRKLEEKGITVLKAVPPAAEPKTAMAYVFKAPDKVDALSFRLSHATIDGMKSVAVQKTVHGDTVEFTAPIDVDLRGDVRYEATLCLEDEVLATKAWTVTLPQILEYKMHRKHFYPGETTLSVAFKAHLKERDGGPLLLKTSIDDVEYKSLVFNNLEENGEFSLKGLELGRHVVTFTLFQNDRRLTTVKTDLFIHPEPTVRIRDDGTLLIDGKPFFPMGMYHVSWSETVEHRKAMIADIAQYGYNAVHVGITQGEVKEETYGDFLDECQRHGVHVITEFRPAEALDVIRKYKDHPAVLGWNPGDEPCASGVSPQEMFSRYDSFKQLDPNHIAYTVICTPSQYRNYASGTDVLAPDPYPVPNQPFDSVYINYRDAYTEARKFDTSLWAVPQCFGYDDESTWPRYPTADEYRCMLYLALIGGAKGFINYTYFDQKFSLPKADGLWDACKTLPTELQPLQPFILNGKRTVQLENDKGIYAATWTLGGRTAIVIVNGSPNTALPFALNGDFDGATIHFGVVEELKATSTGLSGTLRPCGQAVLFTP